MGTSPSTVAILAHLVEETCGIHYSDEDRVIFASKLEAFALRLECSPRDYYCRLLDADPDGVELAKLIEAIVVRETYFFRELAPLAQLVEHLAGIVRSRGRARVWSSACSTGEEPFTLAMLLDDAGLLEHVEIVASDLSAIAIERANSGRHNRRALRDGHPQELAARYLATSDLGIVVAPRIRAAVSFRRINLLDREAITSLGLFDAIVCRNVLIYFRDDCVARVTNSLTRVLAPDGLIAVGIAESLVRFGSVLVCEARGSSYFYRSAR